MIPSIYVQKKVIPFLAGCFGGMCGGWGLLLGCHIPVELGSWSVSVTQWRVDFLPGITMIQMYLDLPGKVKKYFMWLTEWIVPVQGPVMQPTPPPRGSGVPLLLSPPVAPSLSPAVLWPPCRSGMSTIVRVFLAWLPGINKCRFYCPSAPNTCSS